MDESNQDRRGNLIRALSLFTSVACTDALSGTAGAGTLRSKGGGRREKSGWSLRGSSGGMVPECGMSFMKSPVRESLFPSSCKPSAPPEYVRTVNIEA